ncbi:MAG: hypothetical protein N3C63_03495 [Rhodocyclaceae bacterium]|nr:hypothetical protein [Rhodocyclaceae bacterium]
MRVVPASILTAALAASLWLWAMEGFVPALAFFIFGLIIAGVFAFALQLGDAAGGFIDRFIRRHGHPDR